MMSAVRAPLLVLFAAATLLFTACVPEGRPDAATWRPHWQALIGVIPDQSEIGKPPDDSLCQATLADVREQRKDLLPSPSDNVDDLANEWVAVAEEAFFDCPPAGRDIDSFADAYAELHRLENSVETILSEDG